MSCNCATHSSPGAAADDDDEEEEELPVGRVACIV
jgi:hypothetical protein